MEERTKLKLKGTEPTEVDKVTVDKYDIYPTMEEVMFGGANPRDRAEAMEKCSGVAAFDECLVDEIAEMKSKRLILKTDIKLTDEINRLEVEIHKTTDIILEDEDPNHRRQMVKTTLADLIEQRNILSEAESIIKGRPLMKVVYKKDADFKRKMAENRGYF